MVAAAITGKRAAAVAWSDNADERRKMLFSNFMEGTPFLVFDNIPRGVGISCQHIDASLTLATMRDRVLGQSKSIEVPTTTMLAFTGNNISAKGDFASRSLTVDINVSSADPENRTFAHPDPIAWTLAYRRKILRAFYTIMMVERNKCQPPTRFKTWWRLIGQPIEIGSSLAKFIDRFKAGEADDEETVAASVLYSTLHKKFDTNAFTASDVAEMLDWESGAPTADGFLTGSQRDDVHDQRTRLKHQAEALRGALEEATGGKAFPPGAPSVVRVGRKLKVLEGRTVAIDGRTMRLKSWMNSDTKTNVFSIEEL